MIRKLLLGLAGVLVVGGIVFAIFQKQIAVALLEVAIPRQISRDYIGELPDGLHVGLCGAGGPLPDPKRSGPCVAVIAGPALFVVDVGSGAARNLTRMNLPPGRIDAVLLTHFHSDHIDGLGELALQRWVGAQHTQPLPVFGPTGVDEVVDGFDAAYRQDAVYRTAHHGEEVAPSSGKGMVARAFASPTPGEKAVIWDAGGLRITAFRVEHEPVDPAVGYLFEYGGRSALVSGDTKKSENLLHFAQGVDLLVHEALSKRIVGMLTQGAQAAGRSAIAKITLDILDYHTSPVEVAEIAEASGAGHLLFYHVVPPLIVPGLEAVFLDGVSDTYSGEFTLGRDGTLISLPRDSDLIEIVSQ